MIVELGHNLGLSVVGEGVETPQVLGELASTGRDVA
jgi:EAL domain-containing protein (putative c-di-GMP-specific phosphodiesterase class I)